MVDAKKTFTGARICKRLRSPGIDSKKPIPPALVARRAGTSNRVVAPARQAGNQFLGSLKGLQIRAQISGAPCAALSQQFSSSSRFDET
jgi:hypothetical protein